MQIEHQKESRRFAAEMDHGTAELAYSEHPEGVLDLQHTFVPPEERGEGAGDALVRAAVDFARSSDYRLAASCPFVRAWLERNPEAADVFVSP